MAITLNGSTGVTTPAVTNEGAYTGDGVVFADATPSNTLVTTTGGNVGIGTSSPSSRLTTAGNVEFRSFDGTTLGYVNGSNGTAGLQFDVYGSNTIKFTTAGSERVRIDNSGSLLVGKTSTSNDVTTVGAFIAANGKTVISTPSGIQPLVLAKVSSSGAQLLSEFFYNGSSIGNILSSGSTTSYNTSSDYRLKENIAPMTGALAKVSALKPCTYTWKSTGEADEGFIAHELAEVCPSAVSGEKDAVNEDGSIKPQGIDTSFLVATLTAAIQEQQAIITDLKARIETLENK